MLVYADTMINSMSLYDNSADSFTNGIYISHSNVDIINSNFNNRDLDFDYSGLKEAASNSNLYGGFVYISGSNNSIQISDSEFNNGYAAYGGHIYIARSSFTSIHN